MRSSAAKRSPKRLRITIRRMTSRNVAWPSTVVPGRHDPIPRSASSTITEAYVSIRRRWKAGCTIRRRRVCSAPSLTTSAVSPLTGTRSWNDSFHVKLAGSRARSSSLASGLRRSV